MSLDELQEKRGKGHNRKGNQPNRNQAAKGKGKGKGKGSKTQGGVVRNSVSRTTRDSSVPYKPINATQSDKIFGLAQGGGGNQEGGGGRGGGPKGRGGSSMPISTTTSSGGILGRLGGKPGEKPLQKGTPVIVQNIPNNIQPDELEELFAAIGEVVSISINRIKGKNQAEVRFARQSDAQNAILEYHNRELDGQAMIVKIGSNDPKKENPLNTHIPENKSKMFGSSLNTNDVTVQFNSDSLKKRNKNQRNNNQPQGSRVKPVSNPVFSIVIDAPKTGKGKGGKGKKNIAVNQQVMNKPRQQKKPQPVKKTADDLNAEMDAYFSAKAN